MIAVIIAGGSGTRLWPRSRSAVPKHVLTLTGKRSLIQETVARIDPIASAIFVVTEASHARTVQAQLKGNPKVKVLIEPGRRGTASALVLALAHIDETDEPVAVMWADHNIRDAAKFRRALKSAAAVRGDSIVILGLAPEYPATGFGYIRVGESVSGAKGLFKVAKFTEKPNLKTAKAYLASGRYLWNMGYFVGGRQTFEREFERHLPKHAAILTKMRQLIRAGKTAAADRLYLTVPSATLDAGIIVKSRAVKVLPADFGWSDIGSWSDLHETLDRDANGNVFDGQYLDIDSSNCLIYSEKSLVATVGLSDMVVVVTQDVVLVAPKERAQDVKKIVERLAATGRESYL